LSCVSICGPVSMHDHLVDLNPYVRAVFADASSCTLVAHRNMLQHAATHCNTLQYLHMHQTTHCTTLQNPHVHQAAPLLHAATHCNTLQHTATFAHASSSDLVGADCNIVTNCNTPQHTATHGNTLQYSRMHRAVPW